MSRQQQLLLVVAATAGTVVISGCGTSTAPSPAPATSSSSSSTPSAGRAPSSAASASSSAKPSASAAPRATSASATLPKDAGEYGQLLIDAWTAKNRTAAARVATPSAVQSLFAHAPVKDLVNYSCEDTKPVVCGWIGQGDVRIEVSLDSAKVARGARQAVTRVRYATP